jgi:5-methylcytosine-specific restriction endonuclease McrA
MKNCTPKDRNAIKGSLRRAFSRSKLHHSIIEAARVEHTDPNRPRVKNWVLCNICKEPEAKSYMTVDHIDPVIPYTTTFEELGADETIDRIWCDANNLQAVCPDCHDAKTLVEKAIKKQYRDSLKPPKIPKIKKERKSKKKLDKKC